MTMKNYKNELTVSKLLRKLNEQNRVVSLLPEDVLSFVRQARDKGASSWLNDNPTRRQSMMLNKMEFLDAMRSRYIIRLDNMFS